MRFFYFFYFFYFLLFSHALHAKDYSFTHRQMVNSPMDNSGPQVYLFNKDRELTFQADKFESNLLTKFKIKEKRINSESIKGDIVSLINEPISFNENGHTLIFITIAKDIGPCPPCRQQEYLIEKLQSKFSSHKLKIIKITIINEFYSLEEK